MESDFGIVTRSHLTFINYGPFSSYKSYAHQRYNTYY